MNSQATVRRNKEVPGLHRLNHAEEAISLLVNASGEEELVGHSCLPTKTEQQRPQAIDDDGIAFLVGEVAEERPGSRSERIDVPIAEIAG